MFDTTDYKFHYLMDLHYSQTIGILEKSKKCFTTLWIYTILKHLFVLGNVPVGFTTLWIYTILKHRWSPKYKITVSLPYGFTLFSNGEWCVAEGLVFHYLMDLHYSQTCSCSGASTATFHYLMDLHYSQTSPFENVTSRRFHYLMDLHYSQTAVVAEVQLVLFHYLMDLHYSQTSNKLRPLYSAGQIHKI